MLLAADRVNVSISAFDYYSPTVYHCTHVISILSASLTTRLLPANRQRSMYTYISNK